MPRDNINVHHLVHMCKLYFYDFCASQILPKSTHSTQSRQRCFWEADCSSISWYMYTCMFDTKKISILFIAYCIFPQWNIVLTWVCLWMEILLVTAAITMVQSVILSVTMVTVSLDQTQGLVTWEGQMAASQHGPARKPSANVSPSNFVIDIIIVSASPSLWLIHTGLLS